MSHLDLVTKYNASSKQCLPKYNIKKIHTRNIMPFFSESSSQNIGKMKELQQYNFDQPPTLPKASTIVINENLSSNDKLGVKARNVGNTSKVKVQDGGASQESLPKVSEAQGELSKHEASKS